MKQKLDPEGRDHSLRCQAHVRGREASTHGVRQEAQVREAPNLAAIVEDSQLWSPGWVQYRVGKGLVPTAEATHQTAGVPGSTDFCGMTELGPFLEDPPHIARGGWTSKSWDPEEGTPCRQKREREG